MSPRRYATCGSMNCSTIGIKIISLIFCYYWQESSTGSIRFVWLAARAMRNDREVACDSAVLNMLDADSYQDYGFTLINFAEKISLSPFPFSSSLGGTIKQLEQRILNIATYKKPSSFRRDTEHYPFCCHCHTVYWSYSLC